MKNSFAILGLSNFGLELALNLSSAGHDVVALDTSREKIDSVKDKVSEAIIADVGSEDVIKELDIGKFDIVIIGISSNFEDAILALTLVKQEKAQRVIARARGSIQKRILLRLGADEVIQPDVDIAERLSKRLSSPHISDMFEFKGSTIADVKVPEAMAGKSLRQLDLRNLCNITVLLIKKAGGSQETVWNPDQVLHSDDSLTVIGREEDILKTFKS